MDSERAETVLRRFAEAQLRGMPHDGRSDAGWRVGIVGNALVRTGALDVGVADAIDDDVELALAVRELRLTGPRPHTRHISGTRQIRYQQGPPQSHFGAAQAGRPPRRQPRPAPDSIVPLDLPIPLGPADSRGVLHLIAFFRSGAAAWFSIHAHLADHRLGSSFSSLIGLINAMSMTDDTGASYQLSFSGGGNDDQGFHGQLDLVPDPPPRIGWAKLTSPDQPAVRVSLADPVQGPAITVTQVTHTPGEYLLCSYAGRLLGRGNLPLVEMLGDLVTALRAVGALSPLSPVPGQLARLCERQGVYGHGITAAPARDEDMPEPWRADAGAQPSAPHPQNRFAGAAVALPELDGVRLTIIGLGNGSAHTTLHVHVAGVPVDRRDDTLPALWIRDERDGWHATHLSSWSSTAGETRAHLTVWPPLNRAAAIDILACGQSAEVRTTLPLIWR
jgi:hypothetical protein